MFLDTNEIGDEPLSFDRCLDPPEPRLGQGERLVVRTLHVGGTARRGEGRVDLRGRLEARVELDCSRCLESYETTLHGDFWLSVVGDAVEFGGTDVELREPDVSLYYAVEGRVDLREIALEQVYLQLPLKPVCRADCRGLCPQCGADRNRTACGCRDFAVDPRLAPLEALRQRLRNR
jgi:uncharacterized protein